MTDSARELTALLQGWAGGNEGAAEELMPLVYAELRRIAQRRLREDDTLDATALAHEAFLKLSQQVDVAWQNRAHFYAIAARMMRRVLVERFRARSADKRGGDAVHVSLSEANPAHREPFDLTALHFALDKLAKQDERQVTIVELRYFGGLTIEETASALDLSPTTIKREWSVARAWLKRELDSER